MPTTGTGGYAKAGQPGSDADDERNPMVSMPVAASDSAGSPQAPPGPLPRQPRASLAAVLGAGCVFLVGLLAGRLSSPGGGGGGGGGGG
eukprot:SAG22_NODE_950_length_6352_cov_23.892212_1_plen_88_part_10